MISSINLEWKKIISENYSVFRKSALHWIVPELRTLECAINVALFFHLWLHQTDPQLALSVLQCSDLLHPDCLSGISANPTDHDIPTYSEEQHIRTHWFQDLLNTWPIKKTWRVSPFLKKSFIMASCLHSCSSFPLPRYILRNGFSISSEFPVFSLSRAQESCPLWYGSNFFIVIRPFFQDWFSRWK